MLRGTKKGETAMSEESIAALMRELVQTLGKPDLEKPLSYMTDDITWQTPEGTFHGKDQVRRYVGWLATFVPDLTVTESGVGVVVQGDRAAFEHEMQGTIEGTRCTWHALCTYEFAGEKVRQLCTAQDRLSILKQAANGWLQETIVNSLVKRAEKGL
jgi:ketosteroid isomerase-like protein